MKVLAASIVGAMMLSLGSCSDVGSVDVVGNLEYMSGERLDILYPTKAGGWPVVVLVHGAGLSRVAYTPFAELLARSGAVVFNVDWRVLPTETHIAIEDIACAVRYARARAGEYGGDSDRIVLVGHSTGAAYSGEAATNGDAYVGGCRTEGSALPDALAILSPAQVPGGAPWSRLSLGKNPDLVVLVAYGVEDDVVGSHLPVRTVDLLMDAGYDVEVEPVEGGHFDLVLVNPIPGEDRDSLELGPAQHVAGSILGLVPLALPEQTP